MAACFFRTGKPGGGKQAAILTRLCAMNSLQRHQERHRTERIGWLRAAVLGVAAASSSHSSILISGVGALFGAPV